ncbi:SM-like, degradation of cytoplasmic mRNAs and positively regulates transcription initiation [Ascosphaera atra]|nr:SM-like, degradation of cytoplasmic mRNAs and positively regulates transcription initiation [Ascosphaera atra]
MSQQTPNQPRQPQPPLQQQQQQPAPGTSAMLPPPGLPTSIPPPGLMPSGIQAMSQGPSPNHTSMPMPPQAAPALAQQQQQQQQLLLQAQQAQAQEQQRIANAPTGPRADDGPPQLPPQMFTTAAQLLNLTDKKLVLSLRDGKKLVGILRSWDQFANLVFQDTVERIYAGNLYAEQKRGIYIVRGENVLLLGEIDLDKDDSVPAPYQLGDWNEVMALKEKEDAERKKNSTRRGRKLHMLGFEAEHSGEILF